MNLHIRGVATLLIVKTTDCEQFLHSKAKSQETSLFPPDGNGGTSMSNPSLQEMRLSLIVPVLFSSRILCDLVFLARALRWRF